MTVAALRFTRTARARILKAGGETLTLDELAMVRRFHYKITLHILTIPTALSYWFQHRPSPWTQEFP